MSKSLIIVESPAKIKTLRKFLGSSFLFESSVGHIRDLPAKDFGIDTDNDFEPTYVTLPDKEDVVKKLQKAASQCDTVYLSPDPDREGEAIAWHIAEILPEGTNIRRATFNAITKEAVLKALETPRNIDYDLVAAQQARRLLDRIVGYKISSILNRRIQRGREGALSAGRVQSVALKLVVDREKEIEAFVPVEYWTIQARLQSDQESRSFFAYLHSVDGKKVEKEAVEGKDVHLIGCKEDADRILKRLKDALFSVQKIEKKEKRRNPVPPFITSTLQQEASRHYGFSSSRTMSIAQSLYEGIDLGTEGSEGLITYMRTDSVRTDPGALQEVRGLIKTQFGPQYLPKEPRSFKTKKSAQDAHEAIRPTNLVHSPDKVKAYLTKEQHLLYLLIWRRFVASQMMPAVYDTVSCNIVTEDKLLFRATGSVIKFPGFLAVYEEKEDDRDSGGDAEGKILPPLEEGQELTAIEITSDQAFTRPPPRFSEASLVKELEKSGIGRPSTYATIMNKIQSRDYTVRESGRLKPTELGQVIAAMLETNFQQIMNIGFTAHMEDDLEAVADSLKDWRELVKNFWNDFIPTVEIAEKEAYVPKIPTDIDCPACGQKLQKVWARSKYFYGCSAYPDCGYTAPIEELTFDKSQYAENFDWDQSCPLCQSEMKIRHGRYGAFLGCSKYPDCRGIVSIPKKGETYVPPEEMPPCPAIGCPGRLMARKSRFGKTFYSCSTYPDCDVIVNSLEEVASKYPNHERTPYVKKSKGKGKTKTKAKTKKTKATAKKTAKPRQVKPSKLSPELAAIVGQDSMPRTQVIKAIWDYIKSNSLQDPKDKRMIVPDEKLAEIFGHKEPVKMFQLTGLVSKHIMKSDP